VDIKAKNVNLFCAQIVLVINIRPDFVMFLSIIWFAMNAVLEDMKQINALIIGENIK
jgi:hypothetical protein